MLSLSIDAVNFATFTIAVICEPRSPIGKGKAPEIDEESLYSTDQNVCLPEKASSAERAVAGKEAKNRITHGESEMARQAAGKCVESRGLLLQVFFVCGR